MWSGTSEVVGANCRPDEPPEYRHERLVAATDDELMRVTGLLGATPTGIPRPVHGLRVAVAPPVEGIREAWTDEQIGVVDEMVFRYPWLTGYSSTPTWAPHSRRDPANEAGTLPHPRN